MDCVSPRNILTVIIMVMLLMAIVTASANEGRVRSRSRFSRGNKQPDRTPRKRQAGGAQNSDNSYYPGYRSSSRFCYQAGEGFHPNEKDCTKFIRCVEQGRRKNGRIIMTRYDFSCAPGTVYDPDIFVCNFPGAGGTPEFCEADLPEPEPEPSGDEPKFREPTTTPTTTTEVPTPTPPEPLMTPPTTTTMPPECNCNISGTVRATTECDPDTGACLCKKYVDGPLCDTCKRAYFNFEGENEFGCSPCFCFGHTKDCSSAQDYNYVPVASQFAKKYGKWTAEDGNGAPVEIKWVRESQDISVTAKNDNQIIYYLTPESYLGEQRRSFGRSLNFTLHVDKADIGATKNEPLIIVEGSGLRVTLSITNQPGFGPPFPTTSAKNYSVSMHPDFGWVPRLSENKFLVLLSNLTAIKIKGTYSAKGTSYLDNIYLETARQLPNGPPVSWVEECFCPEGYAGLSCEFCTVGFMRKTCGGDMLDECIPCDCAKLKACSPQNEAVAASLADCNCAEPELAVAPPAPMEAPTTTTTPSTTTASTTTSTTTPTTTTTTTPPPETTTTPPPETTPPPPPETTTTPAPTTTTPPPPCDCNTTGAVGTNECHPGTSDCVCKQNVMGRPACDMCSDGFFNLEASNALGCLPCFCFGHGGPRCSSAAGFNFLPVRSVFAKKFGKWTVEDSKGKIVQIQWDKPTQAARAVATEEGQQLYFVAPDSYLGEQRRSFKKFLNFTLYIDNEAGSLQLGNEDIILEGNGLRVSMKAFNAVMHPKNAPQDFSFLVHPDAGWEPKLSEPQFIKLLSKLTALKIRATFTDKGTGFLDNAFLETARKLPGGEPVGWVEECECPPGFSGLSCEDCASGYMRATCGGDSFDKCVPCDCSRKCPNVGEQHNSCTCP